MVFMALVIVFAIYMYWPVVEEKQIIPKRRKAPEVEKVVSPSELESQKEAERARLRLELEDARILTNPFALRVGVKRKVDITTKKTIAPPAKEVAPVLEGVWVDSSMKVAFISGQAVSVGEIVNGWRVTGISERSVTITKGSRTKVLRLEGE